MTCTITYNKDKYGEEVTKVLEDVKEIQEVSKLGIVRFLINLDGHRIYKEFKKNDTMKINIVFEVE